MTPENFPGCNYLLSSPKDQNGNDLEVVGALPVQVGENGFVSHWRPNRAEINAINLGAPVKLFVLSNAHPPVLLEVGNP